ncbi:UNVERIFIED_CONTAM: hypothetical protein GTU68_032240 [Idotea baltica]|nr:hypothetical protein [Idotea baltica]
MLKAKLVDFFRLAVAIQLWFQIEEHQSVRQAAGVFDVSHMTVIDITGSDAQPWLRGLLTNDVAKLAINQALYSCMCNEEGGVLDDLIVYKLTDTNFRLVVNAATREKDIAWLQQHLTGPLAGNVKLSVPQNNAMLAVQGPQSEEKLAAALASMPINFDLAALKRFYAAELSDWFIGRTGYTGEDGFEIILPAQLAPALFNNLLDQGVRACGLGARDTLRLEAGMCLYGQDLDENHSPIQSGIGWAVDVSDAARDFIGRDVLYEQKVTGTDVHQVALVLQQRGIMRAGQVVQRSGTVIGTVTSGTFSPSLQKSIALARVNKPITDGCDVLIREKPCAAVAVNLPFTNLL